VLDAPEDSYAPEPELERVAHWPGGGPAPAGALQRGFTPDSQDDFAADGSSSSREGDTPYLPRRGSMYGRWRGLPRSVGGRIVLACVAVGVVGTIAVAIAGIRYYLMHDDRFLLASSGDIQITGDAHLTRAQVLTVFGADLERNIFRVSLTERRADLERLPWVQHATVMRLLPNQIRVAITERTPVAFVRQGTQIGLVDAGGVLLDMPPQDAGDPKYSFPVLTGLSPDDALTVRAARMEVYKRFIQELDGTGEHLSSQLSEVDVSNPEDVKALVASGGTDILVHFGDEKFLDRFREFQQHLPEWHQQYPKLASADMRYEGQIVLEMQQGAGVPVNNVADGSAALVPPTPADAKPAPKAVAADAKAALHKAKTRSGKKVAPKKTAAKAKKNTGLVTP
jgi:cell division protein FtsQ